MIMRCMVVAALHGGGVCLCRFEPGMTQLLSKEPNVENLCHSLNFWGRVKVRPAPPLPPPLGLRVLAFG